LITIGSARVLVGAAFAFSAGGVNVDSRCFAIGDHLAGDRTAESGTIGIGAAGDRVKREGLDPTAQESVLDLPFKEYVTGADTERLRVRGDSSSVRPAIDAVKSGRLGADADSAVADAMRLRQR
jgi:hypothetical protein